MSSLLLNPHNPETLSHGDSLNWFSLTIIVIIISNSLLHHHLEKE
jgi:hypothetical protein